MKPFYVRSLVLLFTIYLCSKPVLAQPLIWLGTQVEEDAKLLSGNLKIIISNGLAIGSIGGLKAQAKIDGKHGIELIFAPPGTSSLAPGTGVFKGNLFNGKELIGHWIRPNLKKRGNVPYASPVHFSQSGAVHQGIVRPFEDKLTIYFIGNPKDEGRFVLTVFVPENNAGRYYSNAELLFTDGKAVLTQTSRNGEKEVITGSYDAAANSFRLFFPYWGGEILFHQQTDDALGLLGRKHKRHYNTPSQKQDGWLVAKPEEFGIDSKVLEKFANMLITNPAKDAFQAQTEAFLLARNGVLIFESYFRGFDANQLHDLRSASKSLTAILPGLAEKAGWINNTTVKGEANSNSILEEKIYETLGYQPKDPKKYSVTLEHALSMSTGLDCDDNQSHSPGNEETMHNQQEDQDWFRYILALDLLHKPGSHTAYCSGGINLAGAVLTAKTDLWIPALIENLFAGPLGISDYQINLMPDGQQAYSGGGLHLRARDFLKLGQLMLNNGRWQDNQLLDPTYVKSVITPRGTMNNDQYGLGWWMRQYQIDERSYNVFYAGGNGGQQIIVVPELDMVAVFLGSAYSTRGSRTARDDWFPNIILKDAILVGGRTSK